MRPFDQTQIPEKQGICRRPIIPTPSVMEGGTVYTRSGQVLVLGHRVRCAYPVFNIRVTNREVGMDLVGQEGSGSLGFWVRLCFDLQLIQKGPPFLCRTQIPDRRTYWLLGVRVDVALQSHDHHTFTPAFLQQPPLQWLPPKKKRGLKEDAHDLKGDLNLPKNRYGNN
ncbi:uncharacterized protein BT62DRAFT_365335 [Guyanagaster necrorhizus]|uniref:Uncharacterized protein n=1 Tax=Guyanagaster necrorhizus TaxID=856835 RepID=A0A9P7VKS9_9AGAR|nr:uncharacterized protein BT62DRAFT_365335 [Guyanagaster necrorhizus MCA 3950]KAG7442948.1 hypothetical protein BT62DRAFT_365335 [Guyanagaster necrorhizus MCA 3950]